MRREKICDEADLVFLVQGLNGEDNLQGWHQDRLLGKRESCGGGGG